MKTHKHNLLKSLLLLAVVLFSQYIYAQTPPPGTVTFQYQTGTQTNSYSTYADYVPTSTADAGKGFEFITQGTGTTTSYYTQVTYYIFNGATNDGTISFDRNSTNVTITAAFIRSARTGAATTQGLTTKPAAGGQFKMNSIDLLSISGTPTVSIQAYRQGVAVGLPVTSVVNSTVKTTVNLSSNINFYSIDEIGITGFAADGVRADNITTATAVASVVPSITSFSPTQGTAGTTVTITGSNFTGASSVTIGGVAVSSFTVVSATSITAVVGAGNNGTIGVTTPSGTGTSSGSFTLLYALDKVGTNNVSQSAFSVRQLSTTYRHTAITPPAAVSGFTNSATPLMRIRRTSDNAQLDIGYLANGDLDTITIKCFTGSNSAYVTIWYDQSSYSRDASQATTANQPRVVNAGVIERSNGLPAVRFVQASQTVLQSATPASTMFTSGYIGTAASVMEAVTPSNGQSSAWGYANNGNDRWQVHADVNNVLYFQIPGPSNSISGIQYTNNGNEKLLKVYEFVSGSGTQSININNTTAVTGTNSAIGCTQTTLNIGGIPAFGNTYYDDAHQSELIFYNTALSAADLSTIYANENSYFTPTTYYSKASGDLTLPATWGTAADGTGTAPADFLGSAQNAIYKLANRASYTLVNDWTVNATLNIPAGSTLNMGGKNLTIATLAGTGTLTGNTASSLTLTGTAGNIGFATGAQTIKNLTVNACASGTFTTTANILDAGLVTLNNNATLNTGNFLYLKSSANGTASIAPVGSNVTVNGNLTVERYISDKRSWRLLTSAVNSTQTISQSVQESATSTNSNPNLGYGTFVTGGSAANGFDQNYANNPSMYVYNTDCTALYPLPNTTAVINAGPGSFIFVRGSRAININDYMAHSATILRSTGTLNMGTQAALSVASTGYTLVGNPFPSAIDFKKIVRTNVVNRFYVWDYNLNTVGGFVTYDDASNTGTYTVTPSNTGLSNYIQSGEAFLVQPSGSNGTMQIGEAAKVTNGTALPTFSTTKGALALATQTTATLDNNLRINLQVADPGNNASVIDGVMASYSPGFSNKVDYMDAGKLTNFNENIALKRDTSKLSIERRATITNKDTLFIQLYNMSVQPYLLQIDPSSFKAAGLRAYLVDAYLKTRTLLDLGQTSSLPFTVTADAASYNNRFSVAFDQPDIQVVFTTVTAVNQNGIGKVSFGVTGEYFVKQYDVEKQANGVFGSIATITQSGLGGYSTYDNKLQAGLNYYRVKATDIYGNVTYSQTVSLNGDAAAQSVKVYPNPAVGKHIVLNFSNMPKGDYSLTLISPMGQQLKSETVSYDGSALSAALDAYGPAGVYLVNIKSATYNHTEKVFVN